jgi:hypothetical protein
MPGFVPQPNRRKASLDGDFDSKGETRQIDSGSFRSATI